MKPATRVERYRQAYIEWKPGRRADRIEEHNVTRALEQVRNRDLARVVGMSSPTSCGHQPQCPTVMHHAALIAVNSSGPPSVNNSLRDRDERDTYDNDGGGSYNNATGKITAGAGRDSADTGRRLPHPSTIVPVIQHDEFGHQYPRQREWTRRYQIKVHPQPERLHSLDPTADAAINNAGFDDDTRQGIYWLDELEGVDNAKREADRIFDAALKAKLKADTRYDRHLAMLTETDGQSTVKLRPGAGWCAVGDQFCTGVGENRLRKAGGEWLCPTDYKAFGRQKLDVKSFVIRRRKKLGTNHGV